MEYLDTARYRASSYLSYVKHELSPDKLVRIMTSINEAKLISKEVHFMLWNVKTAMKQRNIPCVPNYIAALVSVFDSIDKSTYEGGALPHVYTFMIKVEKHFKIVKIPVALQGSYIRNHFLRGKALSRVESSLPVGKQASKLEIFDILKKSFGNSFLILISLMKKHEGVGPIPSSYHHYGHYPCDWKDIAAFCQRHMQVFGLLEALLCILGDDVLNIE